MRTWSIRTKLLCIMGLALTVFLTYIYFRVRLASGIPVVHTVWSGELASLLRTIARSVQILGVLAGVTSFFAALQRLKAKQPFVFVQMFQAVILCGAAFMTPDLAARCIPVLFGVMFDF